MMKICCFDLEIRVIMLPRNIKHADRHNFESHRSKSRRVWPCSASPWSQISLAKILDFRQTKYKCMWQGPSSIRRMRFSTFVHFLSRVIRLYYYVIRILTFSFALQLAGWSDSSPKKSVLIGTTHAWDSATCFWRNRIEHFPAKSRLSVNSYQNHTYYLIRKTGNEVWKGEGSSEKQNSKVTESHACVESMNTLFLGLGSLHPASCHTK